MTGIEVPEDYTTFRIMRLLHMTHPDQVDELPLEFASWVLEFHAVEERARVELEKREAAKAG